MVSKDRSVQIACLTLCDPIDYTFPGILQGRILEWVAYPFSRGLPNPGIKPPKNRTGVSCIAGGFFKNWAIREAQIFESKLLGPTKNNLSAYTLMAGFSTKQFDKDSEYNIDHKEWKF